MKFKNFSFITSELMLVFVSVGLSIELVKWISPILNGDNFTGIIIVKAVLLIICVSGIYSVLSRLNTLLFKAVDKTNSKSFGYYEVKMKYLNFTKLEKLLFYIAIVCLLLNIVSLLFGIYREVGLVCGLFFASIIGYILHKKQTR